MIDVTTESLISLNEASRLPELRIDGRPMSLRSLWRLALGGKLETLKVCGRRCTTAEAVRRMISAQNPGALPTVTPTQRRREIRSAESRLEAAGI